MIYYFDKKNKILIIIFLKDILQQSIETFEKYTILVKVKEGGKPSST